MNPLTTPDLIAYGLTAGLFLIGVGLIGWLLGLNERDQRDACEKSELNTRLAITDMQLQAARNANRKLAMKAAIGTSPLVSRHG